MLNWKKYIAVYLCFNYWLWRSIDICGIWINDISDQILVLTFFLTFGCSSIQVFKINGGLKSSYFSLLQSKVVPQTCWISVKQSWKHPWLLENNFPWPQLEYRVVLHLEMWCNNTDGIAHLLKKCRINCSCIFCWSAAYLLWVILTSLNMFFSVLPKMFVIICIIPVFSVHY